MVNHNIFIPDVKARLSLATKLGLPYSDDMQDWEYEVSDFNRIDEFLIEYKKSSTTLAERNSANSLADNNFN